MIDIAEKKIIPIMNLYVSVTTFSILSIFEKS